jgi:hypothetical protein
MRPYGTLPCYLHCFYLEDVPLGHRDNGFEISNGAIKIALPVKNHCKVSTRNMSRWAGR